MLGTAPLGKLPLGVISENGSIVGSVATTEAADAIVTTASVRITTALSVTEGTDSTLSAGGVRISATLSVIDSADTVSSTTNVAIGANFAVTEQLDAVISASLIDISASANVVSHDTIASTADLGLIPGGSSNALRGEKAEEDGRRRRELQILEDRAGQRRRRNRMADDAYQAMLARFRDDDFITFPLDHAVARLRADEDDMIMALMLAA